MDIMEIVKQGAATFINSAKSGAAGSALSIDKIIPALTSLFGGGEGGFDLSALLSKIDLGGLGNIAKSWLGDGENESVEPNQISELFGSDKVSEFASKLGLSKEEAEGGLSDALPQMVDKASSGGSLMDLGGVSDMLGKLF